MKIQVELDLTKPLLRGTRLKYKHTEIWVEFKYEQLPIFYFYCGTVGHNENLRVKRKKDVSNGYVMKDWYGYWLRADRRNHEGGGIKVVDLREIVLIKGSM